MPANTGLEALLRPEDSILVLIDHQPYQFANLHSHEPTMIVNNVVGLAKTAKVFNVPTILTTVIEERGGYLIKGLQDVFPEQKPIDRTFINTWQDERVVKAVKKTGRKQLVLAALWTEICLAMPAIQALADGYDVFVVTDASGGVSAEAHDMAVRRMAAAGAVPITWLAVLGEWQRDWAREETAAGVAGVLAEHGGATAASPSPGKCSFSLDALERVSEEARRAHRASANPYRVLPVANRSARGQQPVGSARP
jgi:nicotinamidase-related amidase